MADLDPFLAFPAPAHPPQTSVRPGDRMMTAVTTKLMNDMTHGLAASLFNRCKDVIFVTDRES